jgi:hypothetical protein
MFLSRVLKVQLSDQVTRHGVSALCKLTRLQEFIFFELGKHDSAQNVLVWCFELLPRLRVAGYKMTQFYKTHLMRVLGPMMAQALSQIASPCTLNLRYLALPTFDAFIPQHVSRPHVQPLVDGCFPNLTQLYMDFTVNVNLMQAVRLVGRQLEILIFRFHKDTEILQLDELLEACPSLSELSMAVEIMQSARKLRPDTLRQLQVLSIECYSNNAQPGLVLQLLRLAPNLRDVEICAELLFEDDLKRLEEVIKQHICLRHLERFHVTIAEDRSVQWKTLLNSMITSAIMHCERLHDVDVFSG